MRLSTRSDRILCYSRFGILPPCTYAVKELATCAEVKDEVQIVSSLCDDERQVLIGGGDSHLEVIMQRDDIWVTNGHSLEYCDLVTDLRNPLVSSCK